MTTTDKNRTWKTYSIVSRRSGLEVWRGDAVSPERALWAAGRDGVRVAADTHEVTLARRFATIGDDGMRPVVWGLGNTEDASHADAIANLHAVDATSELRTVPVTEERYQQIAAGDVDAAGL